MPATLRKTVLPIAASSFLLGSCGSFQLASAVYPPAGKSSDQQQIDNLACKDRARLEANTAERQAGAFLLGMTIVGAPAAFELEKAKQREVYGECMTARGYRVIPATDEPKEAAQSEAAAPRRVNYEPPRTTTTQTIEPAPSGGLT